MSVIMSGPCGTHASGVLSPSTPEACVPDISSPSLRLTARSIRIRRPDVVFGFRHTHQPFIEPTDDVLQALDPVPGLSRPRKLVRLVRKANHDGGNPLVL